MSVESAGSRASAADGSPQWPEWLEARERRVEPEWIDYNGHMNVAYYGLAFDRSLDEILEEPLGIGPGYVRERQHGPYVLQNHVHYLAELLEGEAFRVRFRMLDADAKRVHVFLEMIRSRDGTAVATSEQLIVNVDLVRRRSAPFPEDRQGRIRSVLESHAGLPRPKQAGQSLGIRRKAQD